MNTAATTLPEELADLRWAHRHLEHPSFAARLSCVVGTPIEQGLKLLPRQWHRRLQAATEVGIRQALRIALASQEHLTAAGAYPYLHRLMAVGSGAVGGFFGPLALLAELPVTTVLMLRAIADLARSQGEDLGTPAARLACLEVFALGGRSPADSAANTGYYGLRTTLAFHFTEVLNYIGVSGTEVCIPAGVNLVRAIAARFGVVISDKVAVQMIPVVSAVSGALLNLAFMQHFQDVARGHFIVRRLERQYGADTVRVEYERLTREETATERGYSPLEGW